ncbi:MAG: PIN domain-containing protein [Acidobacteriota bacterium]
MEKHILKIIVIIVSLILPFYFDPFSSLGFVPASVFILNLVLGFLIAVAILALQWKFKNIELRVTIGAAVGVVVGAWLALIVNRLFPADLKMLGVSLLIIRPTIYLFFLYTGITLGARTGERFAMEKLVSLFKEGELRKMYKILDTSIIIDGRIADLCETGFIDGILIIPQFVLKELQYIADSSDSIKRNRGRKGLDVLQRLKKSSLIKLIISEVDFPEIHEVDIKLIELARQMNAKIITNDFNLNKVAQLRGIDVLNINELANALKPVVLPGEIMKVFILKEGKEMNQGVGYLDDGTMVVVDNARRQIGKTIDITVTSVLQTTAGKMFFGRYGNDTEKMRKDREES